MVPKPTPNSRPANISNTGSFITMGGSLVGLNGLYAIQLNVGTCILKRRDKTHRVLVDYKKKRNVDGKEETYKAKLVVKGIDYEETFSPVAMLNSIHIFLSIAMTLNYEMSQMDIKIAFLNVYLEESTYMISIYGLKQTSCLRTLPSVKLLSTQQFSTKDLGETNFVLGIRILKDQKKKKLIEFSQASYIYKILKCYAMVDSKKGSQPSASRFHLSLEDCPKTVKERINMRNVLVLL
ncbi:gag/pol protein [Gossypium australe]|uniref:Gag/pol protein n=1 Tax=Gossypium australe TaxID=47621 RepID=A0A5B6VKY2_9ROSI|nr:gag/pol protein [Gossypium australe]